MTNDNILLLKNTVILFIRLLITSLIGLFTSRFVIRSLGAADYGLYSVVGGIVVMMAFLNTVMITTTYRYIAFEMGKGNTEGINKVFNISMIIHFCLALLILILTETMGVYYVNNYLNIETGKLADALFVLRFSTYATVFSVVSIPYQGLVTAQEKFSVQATIEIIRSILLFIAAIIIVLYLGNRIRLYAILMVLASIVPALLFYIYCKHNYAEIIKWNFQHDKNKYKEMVGFSSWIMFGAASSIGKTTGSALIINFFFGTVLNAAYGIANQVNSLVLMFSRSLGQAAIPQITKSFSSGNSDRSMTLVAYISKYTCFLMLLPSLPILLETDYLLNLWLGDLPPYTVVFCQLMVINALIESLGSGIPSIIQATGKIKFFQIILSIISLLSLPIAYFLFKYGYSPSSIIVAYISTAILNVVVRQILLKKIIHFNVIYFLKTSYFKIFYVLVLIAPLFFLHKIFHPSFFRFLVFSIFSIFWLIVAIFIVGIEKNEREMISQVIKKILN